MVGIINPPRGPRSTSTSLDNKLNNISSTCMNYSKPVCEKASHHKCNYYVGILDENLEYACICCYNWKIPTGLKGEYPNVKDKPVDYMRLYKEDSVEFLAYFSRNTNNSKKKILNNIFESDFVNEEVIAWLEKNEMDIMREAAFN